MTQERVHVSQVALVGDGSMGAKSARKSKSGPAGFDLQPYAGRWVALVRGRVAGVGFTAEEARLAAKLSRPKEEPEVLFVPPHQPHNSQSRDMS